MWEVIDRTHNIITQRAKVPGGWLVSMILYRDEMNQSSSMIFFPDPHHAWVVKYEGTVGKDGDTPA